MAKEALFLAQHASKVYIIVRKDVLELSRRITLVMKEPKIEVLFKKEVAEITGNKVSKDPLKSDVSLVQGCLSRLVNCLPRNSRSRLGSHHAKEIIINRHSETNVAGRTPVVTAPIPSSSRLLPGQPRV